MADDLVEIEIDGEVVAELQQVREPEARRIRPESILCRGQQASSLSAEDRKTISPGAWPRSRAALPSEMLPGLAARRCIGAQTAPASARR
jgi:hypothetical protein